MSVAATRKEFAAFALRKLCSSSRAPTNLDKWMASKSYMLVTVQGHKGEERYLIAEKSSEDEKGALLPLSFDRLEDALQAKAKLEGQKDDGPAGDSDGDPASRTP